MMINNPCQRLAAISALGCSLLFSFSSLKAEEPLYRFIHSGGSHGNNNFWAAFVTELKNVIEAEESVDFYYCSGQNTSFVTSPWVKSMRLLQEANLGIPMHIAAGEDDQRLSPASVWEDTLGYPRSYVEDKFGGNLRLTVLDVRDEREDCVIPDGLGWKTFIWNNSEATVDNPVAVESHFSRHRFSANDLNMLDTALEGTPDDALFVMGMGSTLSSNYFCKENVNAVRTRFAQRINEGNKKFPVLVLAGNHSHEWEVAPGGITNTIPAVTHGPGFIHVAPASIFPFRKYFNKHNFFVYEVFEDRVLIKMRAFSIDESVKPAQPFNQVWFQTWEYKFNTDGTAEPVNALESELTMDGNEIVDASKTNSRVIVNGAVQVEGVEGDSAMRFDGVNDSIKIRDYHGVHADEPRTVSAWVKTTKAGTIASWGMKPSFRLANPPVIYHPNNMGRTFSICVEGNQGQKGALSLHIDNHSHIVGSTDLRDGEWHHVAVTYEGKHSNRTLDGGTTKLYVDGVEEEISALNVIAPFDIYEGRAHSLWDTGVCTEPNKGGPLTIGVDRDDKRYFQGDIDHFRVWRKRLSSREIAKSAFGEDVLSSGLFLEVEDMESQSQFAPFQVKTDAAVAGGEYVVVPNGSGSSGSVIDDGIISFDFATDTVETVDVWTRVRTSSGADNSMWYRLDDNDWRVRHFPITGTDWRWLKVRTYFDLEVGVHALNMAYREDGTEFDQFYIGAGGQVPKLGSNDALYIEAEDALPQSRFAPFEVRYDAGLGSDYIAVPNGTGNNGPASDQKSGRVEYTFSLEQDGPVVVWIRRRATNGKNDSFYVKLDEGSWVARGTGIRADFGWKKYVTYSNVAAGDHILRLLYREDGTELDQLFITTDVNATP